MQIICFHNPEEENGYLSNWYPSNFIVDGVHFSSMEQFMMYRKSKWRGENLLGYTLMMVRERLNLE